MALVTRPRNPTFSVVLPQSNPAPQRGSPERTAADTSILQSPPFRAGILAITLFFFIAFFPNVLLAQINLTTLGITVTIGTFGILALILLILFFL